MPTVTTDRAGIVAFGSTDYTSYKIDVSIAHPHSCDLMKELQKSGHAAKRREKQKRDKYEQQLTQSGTKPNFVPFVFEHFGYWVEAAEDYLDAVCKQSKIVEGKNNEADFRNLWRRQVSTVIQKCNAKVIVKKLSKLLNGIVEDSLFDRDIQQIIY